jgi:glycosyltransferase involved in cell wall biosynthesis
VHVLFSVIVPYYRAHRTIGRAINSVERQTCRSFELIIVDDCSPEPLPGDIHEKARRAASRGESFRIIQTAKNGGPAAARNAGWATARGEFVAFLDADDEWHPQKLEICAAWLTDPKVPGIFHESQVIGDEVSASQFCGEMRGRDAYQPGRTGWPAWLVRNRAATPSVIVRRAVSVRFDPTLRYCEDHDLWLRLAYEQGPFCSLRGPALTRLGRPSLTPGGHSGGIWRMRRGEMRMYCGFCRRHVQWMVLLPLLLAFSAAKHICFLLRGRARKGGAAAGPQSRPAGGKNVRV